MDSIRPPSTKCRAACRARSTERRAVRGGGRAGHVQLRVVQAHRAPLLPVRGTTPRTPTSAASRSCSRRRRPLVATSCGPGCTRSSSTRRSRCAGSASGPCPWMTRPPARMPCPPRIANPTRRRPSRERVHRTAEALGALKPSEMQCLILKALGYSYDEIAARTGFSWTKVNRSLTEGRRRFFERFGEIAAGTACRRYQPLLSVACDGHAGADDERLLKAHLASCSGCRAALREYRSAPVRLAELLPPAVVLPLLDRASLWSRINDWFAVTAGERADGDRREAPPERRGGERAEGRRGGGLDRGDRGRRGGRAAAPTGPIVTARPASEQARRTSPPRAGGRRRARRAWRCRRARSRRRMMPRPSDERATATAASRVRLRGGRRWRGPEPVGASFRRAEGRRRRDVAAEFAPSGERLPARPAEPGSSGHESASRSFGAVAGRVRCSCRRRRTPAATTCTPAAGPAGGVQNAFVRVGRREHGRVLDLSSGRIGGDRHRHQGDLERWRCRLLRGRVSGLHRSARSVASERHLRRRRDPAARLLVGGHRRVRPRLRSGATALRLLRVPGRLRRRHAHVQLSHHRASVQPRAGSASRRAAAPRAGVPTTASGFTPGQPRAVLGRERVRACRRLDRHRR